jgi:hypothetical protein
VFPGLIDGEDVVQDGLPVSIPEILGSLRSPRLRAEDKAAVLETLLPMIPGDVNILEEIWDEMLGTHVKWASHKSKLQGLSTDFVQVVLHLEQDAQSSKAIHQFIEHITAYDDEWDDEDEWNALVLQILSFFQEKHLEQFTRLAAQDGERKRVFGMVCDRIAKRAKKAAKARPATNIMNEDSVITHPQIHEGTRVESRPADMRLRRGNVEVMGINTRVQDAVSLKYCDATHTCACLNVVYETAKNMAKDAARHCLFCPLS